MGLKDNLNFYFLNSLGGMMTSKWGPGGIIVPVDPIWPFSLDWLYY